MPLTDTEPSAEDVALFMGGSRTVDQARADSGLSRQRLFALMAEGRVRYRIEGGNDVRLLAWADVARYVAALPVTPSRDRSGLRNRKGRTGART